MGVRVRVHMWDAHPSAFTNARAHARLRICGNMRAQARINACALSSRMRFYAYVCDGAKRHQRTAAAYTHTQITQLMQVMHTHITQVMHPYIRQIK